MRRLICVALLALFACREPASLTGPLTEEPSSQTPRPEPTRPDSPGKNPVPYDSPSLPLELRVSRHGCSVEGARCESGGAMCPVQGVCRRGECVPASFGELLPITTRYAGHHLGPMEDEGSLYVSSQTEPPGLLSTQRLPSSSWIRPTAGGEVRLVSEGLGIGGSYLLSATRLSTNTVEWKTPMPAHSRFVAGTDTGQGVVVVARETNRSAGELFFVRLTDGFVLRSIGYEGEARGLSSDEAGRVFFRSESSTCRLFAYEASGELLWEDAGHCVGTELVNHRGRLFDGPAVRESESGRLLVTLLPDHAAVLVSDEVLVTSNERPFGHRPISFALWDPTTFERRRLVVGGGRALGLSSRGTLLTEVALTTYRPGCASDCTDETGEIREYDFEGGLLGLCAAEPSGHPRSVFANGALWVGYWNVGSSGHAAHPIPGYELAPRGWVTPLGTPGAQRRPRP